MKNLMKIMTIACSVALFAACGNGQSDDASTTGAAEGYSDSLNADTLPVSEADSTTSYRNDMGTDSINKQENKGVPRNP